MLVAQLCLSCDPMECNPPGSIHGILQARILEWVSIPFSRGSSLPRDWTLLSCIAGRYFVFLQADSFPLSHLTHTHIYSLRYFHWFLQGPMSRKLAWFILEPYLIVRSFIHCRGLVSACQMNEWMNKRIHINSLLSHSLASLSQQGKGLWFEATFS